MNNLICTVMVSIFMRHLEQVNTFSNAGFNLTLAGTGLENSEKNKTLNCLILCSLQYCANKSDT